MHKRICTIAFLVLSFACSSAVADTTSPLHQPPSEASIIELLKVSQARRIVDNTMADVESKERKLATQIASGGEPLDAGEQKIFDAEINKINDLLRQEMSWDSMQPMYINLYSKNFSQQDIDDMLAFYRTPAGQSMASKMPALMGQVVQTMQVKMVTLQPQFQQIGLDTLKQLVAYRASKSSTGNTASKSQ